MQLTTQIKLLTNELDTLQLLATMHQFNAVCNYVSKVAFEHQIYNQIRLHNFKLTEDDQSLYFQVRALFPDINSMHIQLAMRRVADAYKTHKVNKRKANKHKVKKPCHFNPTSAITYNLFTLNLKYKIYSEAPIPCTAHLTLSTLGDRLPLNAYIGKHQYNLIKRNISTKNVSETKLVYRKGQFYLHFLTEQKESKLITPTAYIGVDLGVSNIATTSSGQMWSGGIIDTKRTKYQAHRDSLQKCGTPSAKRRLKKVSGREANFRRDINHCISKQIVATSKGTNVAIVLEDLTHIRDGLTVRKAQRSRQHGWSFNQLRLFIQYKAKLAGVPVIVVDPSYTSQRCSACGVIDKKNRKAQFRFSCTSCSHEIHADFNAARNLAYLGNSGQLALTH